MIESAERRIIKKYKKCCLPKDEAKADVALADVTAGLVHDAEALPAVRVMRTSHDQIARCSVDSDCGLHVSATLRLAMANQQAAPAAKPGRHDPCPCGTYSLDVDVPSRQSW